MSNKIKVNIQGFGERYCSNNVEYKLYNSVNHYKFYKKGTCIFHNEYGPAVEYKYGPTVEYKYGSYCYYINNKLHRLNDYAIYSIILIDYYVLNKYIGTTKKDFIKNLANVLIPKDRYCL